MRKPSLGLIEESCQKCKESKTGICKTHLKIVVERNKEMLMLCKDCPVKECPFKDKYDGVCAFEIADEVDWDKKQEVNKMFHRTLEIQRRSALRLGRAAHQSGDRKDYDIFNRLLKNFYDSTSQYLKFKGWEGEEPKFTKKREEALIELKKIFKIPGEKGTENAELRFEKREILS